MKEMKRVSLTSIKVMGALLAQVLHGGRVRIVQRRHRHTHFAQLGDEEVVALEQIRRIHTIGFIRGFPVATCAAAIAIELYGGSEGAVDDSNISAKDLDADRRRV